MALSYTSIALGLAIGLGGIGCKIPGLSPIVTLVKLALAIVGKWSTPRPLASEWDC